MTTRRGTRSDLSFFWEQGLYPNVRTVPDNFVVSEDEGELHGYAYAVRPRIHPSHYVVALKVVDDALLDVVGNDLLRAVRDEAEHDIPFSIMLDNSMKKADWFRSIGSTVMAEQPPMKLDLTDAATVEWLESFPENVDDVNLVPASEVDDDDLVDAIVDLYMWTHESWRPASSAEAVKAMYGGAIRNDLVHDLSTIVMRGEKLCGGVFVFDTPEGEPLDVVVESRSLDTPGSPEILSAALRRSALAAKDAGWNVFGIDGYASDPHVYPLVMQAPKRVGRHLVWFEIAMPEDAPAG